MTKRSNFLSNRTKISLIHKLLPGLYQGFIRHVGKANIRLTFSNTPDEASIETRQKLVNERNFGSIREKIRPFGHILKQSCVPLQLIDP